MGKISRVMGGFLLLDTLVGLVVMSVVVLCVYRQLSFIQKNGVLQDLVYQQMVDDLNILQGVIGGMTPTDNVTICTIDCAGRELMYVCPNE